ncbi:MAG: dihydrodipicolinate synthase family protein, partial [Caldilineaceae bacterium]|nr:dihydrodipicolinate synthase family protein [Caldilineaceae bacterium]
MSTTWRGIFVIVATPYTTSYELDEASLRKEVRFCIDAGVSGLVGPAFASEFMVLSDEERKRWIEIVVGEAAGQIPVIATTHSVWTVPAVAFSTWAAGIGAAGIMNMPPHVHHLTAEQCYSHYQAISNAVNIPVIIQNMIGPIGTPLGSELLARMCRELEQVQYIKEET